MAGSPNSPAANGGERSPQSMAREQDGFLPIANVSRIMKRALPVNGKIGKEAKDTVQECVSEFIAFITSEASDKCLKEKRKTINGDDILWAMATLGFDEYLEPLKSYLAKYRELENDTRGSIRGPDTPRNDPPAVFPGQNSSFAPQGSLEHMHNQVEGQNEQYMVFPPTQLQGQDTEDSGF